MLEKLTKTYLLLLPIAFLTSMAAMELLSWSFFLIFLLHIGVDTNATSFRQVLDQLKSKIDWAIWGYFFVVLIGAVFLVAEKKLDVIGDARWVLLLYSYAYILKKYFQPDWEKYLPILAVVTVAVGLVSFLQFFFGLDFTRNREILAAFGQFHRASGFFNHPLTFAYSIGMVGMFFLSLTLQRLVVFKRADRMFWFLVCASLFAGVGLVTCLSRGAWLAAAVTVLMLFFIVKRKWAVWALSALVIVSTVLVSTNSTIRGRFSSIFTVTGDESNRLRTVLWKANWEIFKDNPLLGVGLSQNKNYLVDYYNKMGMTGETLVSHAHNNYLQILAGTGLLGFIFYMAFSLYFLLLTWRLSQRFSKEEWFCRGLSLGIFSAQIFFHLGGFTQCNFTDGEVTHLLVYMWGLSLALGAYLQSFQAPKATLSRT